MDGSIFCRGVAVTAGAYGGVVVILPGSARALWSRDGRPETHEGADPSDLVSALYLVRPDPHCTTRDSAYIPIIWAFAVDLSENRVHLDTIWRVLQIFAGPV